MFKSLQATIFCFAAVILAIILIASTCSDSRKRAELNAQTEDFRQQNDAMKQEIEKIQQELEATKTEAKILSDHIKTETERSQKYQKKVESLTTANLMQKEQIETAKKQIADLQNKLLVARQIASNAANPQDVKKLEAELKTVKDDLANKNIQLKVLMPQSRKLAEQLLEVRKQLEEATASKAQQPKSAQPKQPKSAQPQQPKSGQTQQKKK